MPVTDMCVSLTRERLYEIQDHLERQNLDGWLLYDFRGSNAIATGLLGLPSLSRRFVVYLPAVGEPIAVTHRIEQQPWRGWIGGKRVYLGWESFEDELRRVLNGAGRIALEYSPDDAVPYLDRVPGGIVDLVRSTGVDTVSSGDLVSAVYSRWSPSGETSHRRAAEHLQRIARAAFDRVGEHLRAGDPLTEWDLRDWITCRLVEEGLGVGVDAVVAVNANAANPHYAPSADEHALIADGDLILIDLWGKENADAIYADQTWMGFVGPDLPERIREVWSAIRDARDAGVDLIRDRFASGSPVAGYEVDDAVRRVIAERGFGEAFIHRTGHSIDRELHGSGPNLDNLETRDTRALIPGVGFSIEPGVYLEGEIGLRTEIDVLMTPDGPVVTTPEPQREIYLIDGSRQSTVDSRQ